MMDQDAAPLSREPVAPPGSELDERVDQVDREVRSQVSASVSGQGPGDGDQEVVAEDLEVPRERDDPDQPQEQGQTSTDPPD